MEQYNKILKQQERHHAAMLKKKHGIVCKQLPFGSDSAPLYLAKPHWTNRFDDDRKSTIGIFCAIWVGEKMLEKNQFAYNIHSKALAKLPGYKLTSQPFAADFRSLVKTQVAKWPGIRLVHGPTTLLQGKETCDLTDFAEKVDERIRGFVDISKHVDELLENAAI